MEKKQTLVHLVQKGRKSVICNGNSTERRKWLQLDCNSICAVWSPRGEKLWAEPPGWVGSGCRRQLSSDVGHHAVDPQVSVLLGGVHQEDRPPSLPRLTLDLGALLNTLHLGHKGPVLHVVPEQHGSLLGPVALVHTCWRRISFYTLLPL